MEEKEAKRAKEGEEETCSKPIEADECLCDEYSWADEAH